MSSPKATQLVDHFFRNEFAKAVSFLTAKFGTQHLEAAEDAVQDALAKAMQTWSFGEVPDNPSGWIITVARNKLVDYLRRQQKVYYATQLPESSESPAPSDEIFTDEMVKMVFATCNPALSAEYQLILTLKILGGLSIREISSALLKKEDTVAKAYTRAKQRFKEKNLRLEYPSDEEIEIRLNTALKVIYLLFNEGYKATEGDLPIRADLCEEAMRLCALLLDVPKTNNEFSRALMALMHFQVSRFDARMDASGNLISLEFQDRKKWNQKHITLGNRYLSSIEDGLSNEYFLQAAIAGIHCAARSFETTNWKYILSLYDRLYKLNPNPLVALHRIFPMAKVAGPEEALKALEELKDEKSVCTNHLFFALNAELHLMSGDMKNAKLYLAQAIEKATNFKEKSFLKQKLTRL